MSGRAEMSRSASSRRSWLALVVCVVATIGSPVGPEPVEAQRHGFWGGAGGGAFWGHVGRPNWRWWAEAWAVGDAVARRNQRSQQQRELETYWSREVALSERERTTSAMGPDRAALQQERAKMVEERQRLEVAYGLSSADATGPPATRDDWVLAIGEENVGALEALVDCQLERASLLARAGGLSENPAVRTAGHWIEAMVAVERGDASGSARLYEELVVLDERVAITSDAEVATAEALAEVRSWRPSDASCRGS